MKFSTHSYLLQQPTSSPELPNDIGSTQESETWVPSDTLVFGPKLDLSSGDQLIQDKYDISTIDRWDTIDIQIDDTLRNTCIRGVPKERAQQVLFGMYGSYEDKIFWKNEYIYSHVKPELDKLSAELGGFKMPEKLLDNKSAMSLLKAQGILMNDRGIIENPEVLDKYKQYIDVLTFLSDSHNRDAEQKIIEKSELVKNFNWLNAESSNEIWDKEYMQIKYAEAILNDIRREWYVLRKDTNGTYSIQRVGGEVENQLVPIGSPVEPYGKILQWTQVNSSVFDIAVVTSILESNEPVYGKEITGQRPFFNKLFNKHKIKPFPDATRTEEINYALLDKEFILEQIVTKKTDLLSGKNTIDGVKQPDDVREYQELVFLESFLGKVWADGEYVADDYEANVFKKANQYRQTYLKEKAFIDGFGWNGAEVNEKTLWETLQAQKMPLALLGIVMLLFKGTRNFGIWAIAAAIFAQPVGNMIDGWVNMGKGALGMAGVKMNDSDLDLIRPGEISPPLSNSGYQKKFEALLKINNTNKTSGRVTGGVTQAPHLSTPVLFEITEDITSNRINIDIDGITSFEDLKKSEPIATKINTAWAKEYTADDIKIYLSLLRQNNASWLKTTLDYFAEDWSDILNDTFSWVTITAITAFDEKINQKLRDAYNSGTTNAEKSEAKQKTSQLVVKLQDVLEVDWFTSENADIKTDDAIALIEHSSLEVSSKTAIKEFLEKTKKYREHKQEVDDISTPWNTFNTDRVSSMTDLNTKSIEIQADITKLKGIKTGLSTSIGDSDLEQELQNTIQEKIDSLTERKKEIDLKIENYLEQTGSNVDINNLPSDVDLDRIPEITPLIDESRELLTELYSTIDVLDNLDVSTKLQKAIADRQWDEEWMTTLSRHFSMLTGWMIGTFSLPSANTTLSTQDIIELEKNIKIAELNTALSGMQQKYSNLKKYHTKYSTLGDLTPDIHGANRFRATLKTQVNKFSDIKTQLEAQVTTLTSDISNTINTLSSSISGLNIFLIDQAAIDWIIDMKARIENVDTSLYSETNRILSTMGLLGYINIWSLNTDLLTRAEWLVANINLNYSDSSNKKIAELIENKRLLYQLKKHFPLTSIDAELQDIESHLENKKVIEMPSLFAALWRDKIKVANKLSTINSDIQGHTLRLQQISVEIWQFSQRAHALNSELGQIRIDISELNRNKNIYEALDSSIFDALDSTSATTYSWLKQELIRTLNLRSTPDTFRAEFDTLFTSDNFEFTTHF